MNVLVWMGGFQRLHRTEEEMQPSCALRSYYVSLPSPLSFSLSQAQQDREAEPEPWTRGRRPRRGRRRLSGHDGHRLRTRAAATAGERKDIITQCISASLSCIPRYSVDAFYRRRRRKVNMSLSQLGEEVQVPMVIRRKLSWGGCSLGSCVPKI